MATALVSGALAVLNIVLALVLRRKPGIANLRRIGAAAIAVDAAAVVAFIWLYSFDRTSNAWVLLFLLSLEAALRYRLAGALAVVAVAAPIEFYRDLWRGEVFGFPADFATQVFRVGILGLVAATAGIMRSALDRERSQVAGQAAVLAEQQRQLADAQEIAHVGSWTWDLKNGSLTWSDELYRIFGREPEDGPVDYLTYMSQVHHDDRRRLERTIGQAVENGSGYEIEHRIVCPRGREKVLQCRGAAEADAAGRIDRLVGTAQDVTPARKAQEALRRAYDHEREMVSKLQEVDRIKSAFVSSVSHELRTPLTSILGYLELLEDDRHSMDASHSDILGVVDRNARRLLSLIEDLLALSRIESRQFESFPVSVELEPVIKAVQQAVLPLLCDRRLELVVEVRTDRCVNADPEQLDRILLNLVTNAIKFTPDGGRVSVTGEASGGHMVLRVSDSGIGIPREEQSRLFQPFYRSSYAQKQAIPGTGLGLVITKTLVERNGGTIEIQSHPGEGTTVQFTIPWSEGGPAGSREPLRQEAQEPAGAASA